jgi:hypothetical protein
MCLQQGFIFLPQYLICKSPSNTTVHNKIPLNPTSHILDILITQCLRRAAPKPEVFLFYQENASSVKQADVSDASNRVCNSTVVVSPHPLSSASSTFSAMKTPEYTEEEPDDPQPADDEGIQMDYSSD